MIKILDAAPDDAEEILEIYAPYVRETAEVSIYVKKDFRGYGTGRLLYQVLAEKLKAQGILKSN